jgi:hypothetical protein
MEHSARKLANLPVKVDSVEVVLGDDIEKFMHKAGSVRC